MEETYKRQLQVEDVRTGSHALLGATVAMGFCLYWPWQCWGRHRPRLRVENRL